MCYDQYYASVWQECGTKFWSDPSLVAILKIIFQIGFVFSSVEFELGLSSSIIWMNFTQAITGFPRKDLGAHSRASLLPDILQNPSVLSAPP